MIVAEDKIKLGIIGAGAIGHIHAEANQSAGGADVVAICDVDAEKLAAAGDKFGVTNRFSDYKKMLKTDVDAVAVCVGNALHREVAIAAIKAGKHVFVEKPMAMNSSEAAEIIAAADKAGVVLRVGMVRRFAPEVKIVREWVKAGKFGNIYHMRAVMIRRRGIPGLGGWFTTKSASGGGPMIDLGVHWFDLAMYMSGLWNPTSVSAGTYAKFGPQMENYKYVGMWAGPPKLDGAFDVEDYSTGFVRFGGEATMSFEIAWAANAEDESFVEILGDQAGARVMSGKPLKILTEHGGHLADIEPKFRDVKIFEVQAAAFVAACRGEKTPNATGQEGLTVMKLIDAIYASDKKDREVAI